MDKSMEKIDIVKLLLYLLIFLVTTFFMVLIVIVPNIKDYRASKTVYKKAFIHKARVQNVLADRDEEFRELNTQNRRAITSFVHKFSTDSFIKYAGKFFHEVSLIEVEKTQYKKEFLEYKLNVSSSLKSPSNFYAFLEGLNRYESVLSKYAKRSSSFLKT